MLPRSPGPGQNQSPSPYLPLPSAVSFLCPSLHFTPACSCIHPSPQLASSECPGADILGGAEGTQSIADEGRASPSSRSYSAGLPDQGLPPGTAGRRVGQRGSRHRQNERSSRSGERAGPRKAGRGRRSEGRDRPQGFCSHTYPNLLLLHHHLVEILPLLPAPGCLLHEAFPECLAATAPTTRALHSRQHTCLFPLVVPTRHQALQGAQWLSIHTPAWKFDRAQTDAPTTGGGGQTR